MRRRVLVAGTQEVVDAARTVLGGELELAAAYSVAEALREVQGGVDLVLCNVRFDDSRMFDFLGALNAMPPSRRVPVICCRVARAPLSGGSRRGIELALEALGVAAFLDMHELEQRDGLAAAQAALREAVMARLAKSG
jgi:response regulator RpfG family c-di-GMP phosphodiesterase